MLVDGSLKALLPTGLADRLSLYAGRVPWVERRFGVVLFADIHGFTALSEQLSDRGPDGADELARLLNLCFGRAVEIITEYKGDIIRFAGDAPIAVFRASESSSSAREQAIERARDCAIALQKALSEQRESGLLDLSIRIGIGYGITASLALGGIEGRQEFVLGGPGVSSAVGALRRANQGDIVIEDSALPDFIDVDVDVPAPGLAGDSHLRPFVPRSVLTHMEVGHEAWIAELRRVTAMFVLIDGIDFTAEAVCDVAQAAFAAVQVAIYDSHGSINQFLVDDKGVMVLAAWGVPSRTHENDAARAIRASHSARRQLEAMGLRAQAGIATGRVFCGWRGNERRREFALIGSTISLAARLATVGVEDTLCDTATRDAAEREIEFEAAGDYILKGASQPVQAFRPGTIARTSADGMAVVVSPESGSILVGRDTERALVENALTDCLIGNGSTVVFEGEAGAGKSALVEHTVRRAKQRDVRVLIGTGNSMTSTEPYEAWRHPLDELLGLPSRASQEERLSRFAERMKFHRDIGARAPLLAAPLGLQVEDTPLTAQMTEGLRLENTRDVVVSLVEKQAAITPLMLVIDDAHWLDSASWSLLLAARRRVPGLLIIVATRPLNDPVPEFAELSRDAATVCHLEPLNDDQAVALGCAILGVDHLPSAVVRQLASKAAGHPLFVVEMVRSLRDGGFIRIEGNVSRLARDAHDLDLQQFPETVQDVILGGLDRLTTEQQLTIKVASVLGYRFSLRMLADIHPVEHRFETISAQLESPDLLGLTLVSKDDVDSVYAFRHSVIRDVAYGLLVPQQRRELHRAAAQWYEREDGDQPRYSEFAHHWSHAAEHERAVESLEEAGNRAADSGAYRETIRFFQQALDIADEHLPSTDLPRRAQWLCRLGQAHVENSAPDKGREALDAALSIIGRPLPHKRGPLTRRLIYEIFRQAFHLIKRPRPVGARDELARGSIEADVLEQLSSQAWFAQDVLLMVTSLLAAINTAERTGNIEVACKAYAAGGYVAALSRLESVGVRWWSYAKQARNPEVRAHALLAQGMHAIDETRWGEGDALAKEALSVAREAGAQTTVHSSLILRMFGEFSRGNIEASLASARESLSVAEAANLAHRQIWSLHSTSTQLLSLEEDVEAWELTNRAVDLIADVTDPVTLATHYAHLIEILLLTRELNEAEATAEKLRALIEQYPPSMNGAHNIYWWLLSFYTTKWGVEQKVGRTADNVREIANKAYANMRVDIRLRDR